MVPNIGHAGGGGSGAVVGHTPASAFVTTGGRHKALPPLLRRRSSTATVFLASSASSSLADDSFYRGARDQSSQYKQQQRKRLRIARPDEPNLFDIPPNLHPTYQTVPILLRAGIIVASALLVGRSGISQIFLASSSLRTLLSQLSQTLLSRRWFSLGVLRKSLSFLLRTALLSTISNLAIQEAVYPPSRVTTKYLAERGELPSSLSRYAVVRPTAVSVPTIESGVGDGAVSLSTASSWNEEDVALPTIGVHSIQYTKRTTTNNKDSIDQKYDRIFLHHGFGASSLSWLPVLPSLVERLGTNAKGRSAVGVAHDAPGFGFTDRPNADVEEGLEQYGAVNNVGIALALLQKESQPSESNFGGESAGNKNSEEKDGGGDEKAKSLAIFGHSMGSKAALLMALHCASQPNLLLKPNLVVLVAPALEGVALPSRPSSKWGSGQVSPKSSWIRRAARRVWIAWRKVFLDYPFRYGLRRLVNGTKDFWRKGLTLAWGDPQRLSDSDALRFQWPSIGEGWEEGLINFTRSRLFSSPSDSASMDDGQLLREVANLKDTKVVIVYGSKDAVVRIEGPVAETLRVDYPNVKLVRMEGLGHDPFEEDVDGFLTVLDEALQ